MNDREQDRVDEVSKYYDPAKKLGGAEKVLFWLIVCISLSIPFGSEIDMYPHNFITAVFVVLVVVHFVISQFSRFCPRTLQVLL